MSGVAPRPDLWHLVSRAVCSVKTEEALLGVTFDARVSALCHLPALLFGVGGTKVWEVLESDIHSAQSLEHLQLY